MQTTQAKVTVVVTVYNVEEYVGQCLESILGQTLQDIEVVVVDDCTPDNSMQVVERYATGDSRIRVVAHAKNHGLMQARRTGYMQATGDYVAFCDSDDTLPPNALEALYRKAVDSGADVVSGDMTYFFPDSGQDYIRRSRLSYGSGMTAVYKSLLLAEYHHNLCGKLFRRPLLQDHAYIVMENFTNGEDGFLFYQIVEHVDKVVHITDTVYNYRQNMQSSSKVRLGSKAIRSICLLNQLRLQIAERHPEILKDTRRKVTAMINSLYRDGYDRDADLDSYVADLGLKPYSTLWSVFKYVPFPKSCKLAAKRVVGRVNK